MLGSKSRWLGRWQLVWQLVYCLRRNPGLAPGTAHATRPRFKRRPRVVADWKTDAGSACQLKAGEEGDFVASKQRCAQGGGGWLKSAGWSEQTGGIADRRGALRLFTRRGRTTKCSVPGSVLESADRRRLSRANALWGCPRSGLVELSAGDWPLPPRVRRSQAPMPVGTGLQN